MQQNGETDFHCVANNAKKQRRMGMTKQFVDKLISIKAVPCDDSNERWVDKDGTIVPIDRKPIDWERCKKPMHTIKEK